MSLSPKKPLFSPKMMRHAGLMVVVLMAVFMAVSLVAMLAGGHDDLWAALKGLSPVSWLLLVGGAVVNNAVRMWRYPVFARRLRIRVPAGKMALYYTAGLAFIATPGKIGTALRLWLLHRHHRVDFHRSAPILLLDNLTDFIALMLLIGLALPTMGGALGVGGGLLLLAGMLTGLVMLFARPGLLRWGIKVLYRMSGRRKPRLFARLLMLTHSLRDLVGWQTLLKGVALSMAAWSLLYLALHAVLQQLGATLGLMPTIFILTASIVLGVLTFLPGGLGGTEATMLSLLSLYGVPVGIALAFTVLMRLATLWLPILVGFAVLPFALKRHRG